MPYSKNPQDYPDGPGFVNLIETTLEKEQAVSFASLREAQHFRARFNGYRSALKFQALAMPHLQAIADAGALVKVQLFKDEARLVFGLLLPRNSTAVAAARRGLGQLMLGEVKEEIPELVMAPIKSLAETQSQASLDKLGYAPTGDISSVLNKPAEATESEPVKDRGPSAPLMPQPKQKEQNK